ncbi:hypothetical protein PG991_000299 [Apiospora marii]|uniref:Fe2OG dioxygenase domain-containing protein n=1 Tax=Apiospora marii TaxID=335849 RepID=A0ABR1T1Q7_9PEZI
MSHADKKRQLPELGQLGPILETKRRRIQGPNNQAHELRIAPVQGPIAALDQHTANPASPSQSQQEATITSSKHQQEARITSSQPQQEATITSSQSQQEATITSSKHQQEATITSSQPQQEATITSSSYQDQQQEDAAAAVDATEIAPATVTKGAALSPDDIHGHKAEPCGRPLAFADKRGQLADALPFNKNHEGFLYTVDNVAKGMILDAATSPHAMINDSVIITTIALMNAFEKKVPVSVVIGSKNPNYPVQPPHPFCLMGFFAITYMWAHKTPTVDGSLVPEYMARLEKVDPEVLSWWVPAETDSVSIGDVECDGRSCPSCGKRSKTVYTAGWACLSIDCPEHFEFGYPVDPEQLVYNEGFLLERHDHQELLPLPPAVPALPVTNETSYGTEAEFKRGIVCPKCGLCSRRVYWWGWACENENENAGCDFKHIVEFTNYPLLDVEDERKAMSRRRLKPNDPSIVHDTASGGGYPIEMYGFPNSEGLIGGAVAILRATPETRSLQNGPDRMYQQMQNEDLKLQRNPARAKGSRREELTSHFAYNYGAFYKFGVFVDSVGFEDAPGTILKGLAQLDWAQSLGITHLSEFIRKLPVDYSDTSMSLKPETFNELLALGYFQGSKISYHDDGEKELGPTVATLSLGSPAIMRFRPKKRTKLGQEGTTKNGDKPAVLSFVLNHGDIVIMHGTDIHREYEHDVIPSGKLRFALTARFVRPETIKSPEERRKAVENGRVPEGIEAMAYKGHEETTVD